MYMTEYLLKIEKVSYTYTQTDWQLRDISLQVNAGEIIGIIGPNGAGKSTLLRIAAGILQPDAGSVKLLDEHIHKLERRRIARILGYLPQNVTSLFDYRVEEVVAMGRYANARGLGFLDRNDIVVTERCLEQTQTREFRDRSLWHLSGGERQRVLLASVLAQEPKILLLDEPTAGLDLHHQVRFFELLAQQVRQGLAVVVVTHDLNLASLFCDCLVLMQSGKVIHRGTANQVLRESILGTVYPDNIHIDAHPVHGQPMVLPLAKRSKCGTPAHGCAMVKNAQPGAAEPHRTSSSEGHSCLHQQESEENKPIDSRGGQA
jgi:iron complex transport system ATP-binding protein